MPHTGKEKCAEILLAHGLSLDDVDVYGQTAMYYAVSENRLELVRKYATRERLSHVDKLVGQTPLYYAGRRGHLDMCRLLIERGSNPAHLDSNGKTAVEYARRAKFLETAEYLNAELKRSRDGKQSNSEDQRRKEEGKEPKQTYKLVFLNEKGEAH
jgi:ankyrin repeat protein